MWSAKLVPAIMAVMRHAAEWLGILMVMLPYPVLVLILSTDLTFTTTEFAVAALVALAGAVVMGVYLARRRTAVARLLEGGVNTEATVDAVEERLVYLEGGGGGTVTTVTVRFTDMSGTLIHASYTDTRPTRERTKGQPTRIVYDPRKPTSISPVNESGALDDPRSTSAVTLVLGTGFNLAISVYFSFRALN
jgi:hypothetical protein